MKKILVTILTVAMMTSAVAAFADGGPQGGPMGGQPPRMEQGSRRQRSPLKLRRSPLAKSPLTLPRSPKT